ncbi:MAG: hypothetical protein DMF51_02820 [Acidobacteria bacterium]|nr:MAG: hypothetical protein DMF51_02820 [Acidobacteriota bacterium]
MRRTPRFQVVAWSVLCLSAVLMFQPAHSRPAPGTQRTIEPSLPLILELRVTPADAARGEPARLEVSVDAATDLRDVTLSLSLPAGLRAESGPLEAIPSPGILRAHDRRAYSVPLTPLAAGDMPIRLGASFQLPDGREFRTEQGTLWRRGPARSEGRHNAGAYEVMGVPVDEPQP